MELDALKQRWREWEALPYPSAEYPPGSSQAEVQGVDLAQADGDAAAVFHQFFTQGALRRTELVLLGALLERLGESLPHLRGDGHHYFATAFALLGDINRILRRDA